MSEVPKSAYSIEGRVVNVHDPVRYPPDALSFSWNSNYIPPPAPVASFTASTASGVAPLTVAFTDTSTGTPSSRAWDFGDGTAGSGAQTSHTYAQPGTYTVTLTVSNEAGTDTTTGTITVTSTAPLPQPDAWDPSTMLGGDLLHPNDLGMTVLADNYVWALDAAGKTPPAGTTLYAYGDSFTASDAQNTPGQRAIVQLADRLGLTLDNRAVSGYKLGDCAARAIGTAPFVAGTSGLAFLQAGVNDMTYSDTEQTRTAITNYLRAWFAVVCAAERIEQTAFTYNGTWDNTTNALSTSSGGSNSIVSSEGAACSYEITTPGTYYLLLYGRDGGATLGGKWTITQGSTVLAEIDTNAQVQNTGNLYTSGYGQLAVRLDNVQAGPLTMTYSRSGRSGTVQGYIDALLRVSSTPPTILAAKPVRTLDASRQKPALLAYIHSQYDAMAAEFGTSVVLCDPEQRAHADFTATPLTGLAPLTVAFTDTSTGGTVTAWAWTFGDGASSSEQNPSHTYTVPGTYEVSLTVTGPGGLTDTKTRTGLVTVTASPRQQVQLMTTVAGSTLPVVDTDGANVLTEIP